MDVPDTLQGVELKQFYEGYNFAREVRKEYIDWISIAKKWRFFVTLTVDPERFPDISFESLEKKVYQLFRRLNVDLCGKNFKRVCGSYYMSWALSVEPHKSGDLHCHFICDSPLNQDLLNIYWNSISGFALVKKIDDLQGAIDYITKDLIKGGRIDQFFRNDDFLPFIKPSWWESA